MQRTFRAGTILGACALFFFASASFAHADSIGQQRTFFTNPSYDHLNAEAVPSTLRSVGQNAYFYVDDRYWAGLSLFQQQIFSAMLNVLRNEFDGVIYPRSTQFWGTENTPGIDHEV